MDLVASPTSTSPHQKLEQKAETRPSQSVTFQPQTKDKDDVLTLRKTTSSPAYGSPMRHHKRNVSSPRQVKESLNARSEYITSQDDGVAEHRINQYIIKQEIGRGSFGAVHLAVDQYGKEYAVKEFSKARLRKRAQSHILRKPLSQRRAGALAARTGFNSPLHRRVGGSHGASQESAIELIKEEIAIMKKLNHDNLVSLIEVLDDPSEDSLYMVMEYCKKGVVMKVGLDERADPYPDDQCRYWFRDLILGIEYLHAQGVVHRDIKPDNCLVTEDDVLKVVDFGVSEMFEKNSEMVTAKSAGSPAFLPPELCVAKHGDISGKAADIWSMGVTLYCLKYGRIPFEKTGIFELYESIKDDEPDLGSEADGDFRDLMLQILEKDPSKRIKMPQLREHPWVTKRGTDPLLSEAENTANLVEPPTEAEMNAAITSNMRNLLAVAKAVNRFKSLTAVRRNNPLNSILDNEDAGRFSQPPTAIQSKDIPLPYLDHKANSVEAFTDPQEKISAGGSPSEVNQARSAVSPDGKPPAEPDVHTKAIQSPTPLSSEVSHESDGDISRITSGSELASPSQEKLPPFRSYRPYPKTFDDSGRRGHAHDPLEDHLYLFVGPSTFAGPSVNPERHGSFIPDEYDVPVVSESPGAADIDIYETAYRDEIERIRARAREQHKEEPQVYLTRRVDAKLLAMSGMAGRLAAASEERYNQLIDYTQWKERKAMVTEVSRALREAAREEYLRRKQEYEEARTERAKAKAAEAADDASGTPSRAPEEKPASPEPSPEKLLLEKTTSSTSQWADRAAGAGRQARNSLMGFVDLMKTKSKTKRGPK